MTGLWDRIKAGPGRAAEDIEELKASGLPLVLYGDGWYAPCVREYLARRGLTAAARLKAAVAKRGLRGVTVHNKGLWSSPAALPFAVWRGTSASAVSEAGEVSVETETVDRAAPDATFIKLDIEGAELEALRGAAETIRRNRPKLAVCVYHKPGDLFKIPLFIKSLVPEYRLYLRQHQPVACETVLYAVI